MRDMKGIPNRAAIAVGLSMLLLVGACAETRLAIFAAKEIRKDAEREDRPDHDKKSKAPRYKVGQPYQVAGLWYYPHDDPKYKEEGEASWYGDAFHGKPTANGDVYDQNAMTAAHKTLPMPSQVQVTNLENNRSVVVTINDRGPFVPGRIIDLSRRAAIELGFVEIGTARVRVKAIPGAGRLAGAAKTTDKERYALPAAPRAQITAKPIDSDTPKPAGDTGKADAPVAIDKPADGATVVAATPPVDRPPVKAATPIVIEDEPAKAVEKRVLLYVQAGTFARYTNAKRLMVRLSPHGQTHVHNMMIQGRELFRVRIGPYSAMAAANEMLARVVAMGLTDARVVIDQQVKQ